MGAANSRRGLTRADVGLRVDFVATRLDGSAVRIHPQRSREAHVTEGTLEEWRSGSIPIYWGLASESD